MEQSSTLNNLVAALGPARLVIGQNIRLDLDYVEGWRPRQPAKWLTEHISK
jgi:hypothetical protein